MTEVKIPEGHEPGHRIEVSSTTADGRPAVMIKANREGRVTLARLFLFMTQPNVKSGVAVDAKIAGMVEEKKSELLLLVVRE